MPLISVDIKKQVKAANDIVDVVSGYLPVVSAGKAYKAVCPFHNDTRPSLQIDRGYQNYRCWACDARGDVFDFVMKFEKVEFGESLRMLADRAGIKLDTAASPQDEARSRLLRVMKWAEEKYRDCLMKDAIAETARTYIGSRRLTGPSVKQFGLGFAPIAGDWLVHLAEQDGISPDLLIEVGLIAPRDEQRGFYDRFRDRVMFPIRDVRGQTVGFGGRILPESPYAARAPKYYNSTETPLFSKSNLLFGLDLARHAGTAAGHLAVVEGYTDVMMAHQHGVAQVVATMGTALTGTHLQQLRRYAPRVVLVYDADEGGMTGVDRALELFVGQDVELKIAVLPEGLDPCDLLVRPGGPEEFKQLLANAQDALEFKLNRLLQKGDATSVEGGRRVVDAILSIMAMAPAMPSQNGQVRQELIVTRLAHRLGLRQETVWARLSELKAEHRRREPDVSRFADGAAPPTRTAPAPEIERQLLQFLLAEPELLPIALESIHPTDVTHPGLQRLLQELYNIHEAGQAVDMDSLRVRLMDRPDLTQAAADLQFVGRHVSERGASLRQLLTRFDERRDGHARKSLKEQLSAELTDDDAAMDLLRRLTTKPKVTAC